MSDIARAFYYMNKTSIMGNVLESDSSTLSDTDAELSEVRTDGDGMEMDKNSVMGNHDLVENLITRNSSQNISSPPDVTKILPIISKALRKNGNSLKSPIRLPPKNQLIQLLPPKSESKSSLNLENHSNSTSTIPLDKQRCVNSFLHTSLELKEAKFVPYEPYKAATRPLVPQTPFLISPQMQTLSQYNSPELPDEFKESSSTRSSISQECNNSSSNHSNYIKLKNSSEGRRNYEESFHCRLLKERLQMMEREGEEVKKENIRLKQLVLDSMTSSGANTSSSPNSIAQAESVDNLSDEIKVWKSKFLSSCVVVEQLTKEGTELRENLADAATLFRDIKISAGLTPQLYDNINAWLQKEQKCRLYSTSHTQFDISN